MGRKGNLDGFRRQGKARAWIAFGCALIALLVAAADAGADGAPSFDAHGSVEQVYATGLTPGASVSLFDNQAQEVETRTANELGGTLFRNVAPGGGYRVDVEGTMSEPLQVLTTASEPPSTGFYDQPIPESGYGYLTTRDGTKLAIYVHPPQDVTHVLPGVQLPPLPAGPTPTLIEYSGYGYADPGRAPERDIDHRQPDGLHGRRRQHARHRLLGRRLRLLRAAAEPRRLRRRRDDRPPAVGAEQRSRDDGDLLRRDQPALHGRHPAAGPGRDLAALGDRQHPDDALPGRHPQHRVRARMGQRAGPRRRSGVRRPAARHGPTSASRKATRSARPTRRCTRRRPTCSRRSKKTTTTTPRSPTRSPRSPSSTRSTCRPSWRASGPTSRPAATARPSPSTSPARTASGSPSPTAPTSTRSTR